MNLYLATIAMAVFAMIIFVTLVIQNYTVTQSTRRALIFTALLISIGALAECLGKFLNGKDNTFRHLHSFVKFIELSVTPLIPVVFSNAIARTKRYRYILPFLFVHAAIEFLSMFFGITFFVDAENNYAHRKFYFLYYVAILIGCGYLTYTVIRFTHRFQSSNLIPLVLISIFVFIGVFTQAVSDSLNIVWLITAIGTILFYMYYCSVILQTNALTELLNRRAFDNRIRSIRKPAGLLFFDVNDFKRINDTFGHQYGDSCLKTVAEAIRFTFSKYGLCFRVGGDEFCVILRQPTDSSVKMLSEFDKYLDEKRKTDKNLPTVAVGYATFRPGKDRISDVIARADQQMYRNKNHSEACADRR